MAAPASAPMAVAGVGAHPTTLLGYEHLCVEVTRLGRATLNWTAAQLLPCDEEAVACIRDAGTDVTLVDIADTRRREGWQAAQALHDAGVAVVAMIETPTPSGARRAQTLGVAGVAKQDPLAIALKALLDACHGRPTLSERVADELANSPLTDRQREILTLLADGNTVSQTAAKLDVGADSVKWQLKSAGTALGVRGHAHIVATALRRGLID